jgi:hypothetical protein
MSLFAAVAQQEFPKIKALAHLEKAELYFGDADHMRSDHHSGRTWGRKGKPPLYPVQGTISREPALGLAVNRDCCFFRRHLCSC